MHFKHNTPSAQVFLWEEAGVSTSTSTNNTQELCQQQHSRNVQRPILSHATKEHVEGKQLGLQADTSGAMPAQLSANEQIYTE